MVQQSRVLAPWLLVVTDEPHAELLAQGGRYAEMWRLQQAGEADSP